MVTKMTTLKDYGIYLIIILIVVCLGLFAINQFISFQFKSKLLISPCDVCKDANKNQSACIDGCFLISKTLYPTPSGDLKDNFGRCFTPQGIQVECKDGQWFNVSLVN